MKVYQAGGMQFAIAQVEVSDLVELGEHQDRFELCFDLAEKS